MSHIPKILQEGFAKRLQDSMVDQGYSCDRKPYFVDVLRLSRETNLNPVMIRRYLGQQALPNYRAIEIIAKSLDVDPVWLFCGYREIQNIDKDLIIEIMSSMYETIRKNIESKEKYDSIVKFATDVYSHVNATNAASTEEKLKLIKWMADGFVMSLGNKKERITEEA